MAKQMEMFETGGLMDEGGTVDPVSGNDVPPGSTQEEVRDDIPAQLSEGEFVFPADVVRFIGLEKLMKIRQRAKAGLQRMEDMGQMGNSEEAIMPDDLPFSIEDLDMEDDGLEMAQGGVVQAANGTFVQPTPTNPNAGVFYNPAAQATTGVAAAPMQAASAGAAPNIGQAATPVQAASAGQPTMFTNYQLPQAPVPVMTPPDQLPKFLGEVAPGVGGIDYTEETYVNEAGQTIKFRRYNDGSLKDSSGNEAVIPEGYVIKSEADKKVTTDPTKVKTATVQDDGDGGGNQEGDGTGTGASIAWGGTTEGAKKGLKVGSTKVGISYFNVGSLGAKGALGFVGGRFTGQEVPEGVDVGMSVGGVTTTINANAYNTAKKAGFMGAFSDGLLADANLNAQNISKVADVYNLNIDMNSPKTVENFYAEAAKTDRGVTNLANRFDIDVATIDKNFFGGLSHSDAVNKAVAEANKRGESQFGKGNFEKVTKEDIAAAQRAFTNDDVFGTDGQGVASDPSGKVSGGASQAAVDAARAAPDYGGRPGGVQSDGSYNDAGFQGDGQDDNPGGGTAGSDPGGGAQGGGYGGGTDCLTEDMKVKLNGVIDFVTNIKVGDMIDSYRVKEVLHKHMRNGYYAINNELKISNDHPVLANGTWTRPEDLSVGDTINGIPVVSLEYVEQLTPTVSIVIDGESFDVHTENNIYTVHGRYKEVRQKAA